MKRNFHTLSSIFALGALISCTPPTIEVFADHSEVTVEALGSFQATLIDSNTNTPAQGVTVTVNYTNSSDIPLKGWKRIMSSDSNGRVSTRFLKPGRYLVTSNFGENPPVSYSGRVTLSDSAGGFNRSLIEIRRVRRVETPKGPEYVIRFVRSYAHIVSNSETAVQGLPNPAFNSDPTASIHHALFC